MKRKITLELDERVAGLLATLDAKGDVKAVILELIDHARQGVYRPGAWERGWLIQAFGSDFEHKLVPGDPYGRADCDHIFQRPHPLYIQQSQSQGNTNRAKLFPGPAPANF
jgi:hypothetical protein